MPFPDPFRAHRKHGFSHAFSLHMLAWTEAQERRRRNRRGRRKDLDDGGVPVEPNRPKNLSGGAAAALEFEDGNET
jgi:hypothetical protein